jgi:hypothetical protein
MHFVFMESISQPDRIPAAFRSKSPDGAMARPRLRINWTLTKGCQRVEITAKEPHFPLNHFYTVIDL